MISPETLGAMITDAADPNDRDDVDIRRFLVAELETVLAMCADEEMSPCARTLQKTAVRSPRNRRPMRKTARRASALSRDSARKPAITHCYRGTLLSPSPTPSRNRRLAPTASMWRC